MDFSAGAPAEKLKIVPSAEGTILSFEFGSGPQAPRCCGAGATFLWLEPDPTSVYKQTKLSTFHII